MESFCLTPTILGLCFGDSIMKYKKCTKCGKELPATKEYFYWHTGDSYFKGRCKICEREYVKNYRDNNLDKVHSYRKKHYEKCKEEIKERDRNYNRQNYYTAKAPTILYAHKLTINEDPIDDGNGYLLVKCAYCGKYFYPTILEVKNRIQRLSHPIGESRLYCSDECKFICPLFRRWSPEAIERGRGNGENHHNWKGGIAHEPYCPIWIKSEFKENIRERDNNQCQNPYCYEKLILRQGKKMKPSVHHINHNKKDCHPLNLITICQSCNARAEGDREKTLEEWEYFYQDLMNKRFMPDGMTQRTVKTKQRHPIIKEEK
jgi:hypothetical protein